MTKARFYHAGCPVCVSIEQTLLQHLSVDVEIGTVHLGEQPDRVAETEVVGMKSIPALVIDGNVLHVNFGAPIEALKQLGSSGNRVGDFLNIQGVREDSVMKAAEEYHPIDCDLHGYPEIACIYHYWLHIELTNSACFGAKALTTCTTVEKEEFLVVGQSESQQKIRLDYLSAITALTPGATFSTVNFQRAYRGQTV